MERSENVTKSIVYGNSQKNNYGVFLPVCSAISQKAHVDRIVDYLKANKHFAKVEEVPVVFITENRNEQTKFYEGCHSDQTIQGSAEKLLHLLEKLSINCVIGRSDHRAI